MNDRNAHDRHGLHASGQDAQPDPGDSGEHLVAKALAAEPPLLVSIGLSLLGIAMAVGAVMLQRRHGPFRIRPAR